MAKWEALSGEQIPSTVRHSILLEQAPGAIQAQLAMLSGNANVQHTILNYLGVAIGVAGILTVVPPLGEMGGLIFGLGQIVWFAWLGIVMLRSGPSTAA